MQTIRVIAFFITSAVAVSLVWIGFASAWVFAPLAGWAIEIICTVKSKPWYRR